jgi:threonine/homoserine/homoserine lactone efflux protein
MPALAEFALTSLVIELTPGPNMTTLAALSLAYGRAAGLSAVAGVATGLALVGVLAAFGLTALIEASPALFQVLRWAGVGWLLWLAFEAWRDADGSEPPPAAGGYFWRGLITNLLNPKAALFYVAVLPTFLREHDGPLLHQSLVLVGVYVVIATLVHTLLVVAAASARDVLRPPYDVRLRKAMALTLAVVALWFAWETRG